ncbi:hypothetical protein M433DRAFT_262694 [Acidomyces richmondensis BFW]|nr:MAG: hypothetical protein FE78DRAFT_148994 [Acidomyces sp. 'richmondensis']KYG45290.1 hypothetical protein M433DRAFT_262694 [Acidomyces richmondensis BFW]
MAQESLYIRVSDDVCLHTILSRPMNPTLSPSLVFLHFWGGSNSTWSSLLPHLEEKYRLILPSLRGWGQSSAPNIDDAFHITNYSNDIVQMLFYLKAQKPEMIRNGIILVGHSMGGKIAQHLLTEPAIQILMKGMILLSPAPSGEFQIPTEEMREQQVHAYDDSQSAEQAIRNLLLGRPDAVDTTSLQNLVFDAISGISAARIAWPAYGMREDHQSALEESIAQYKRRWGRAIKVSILVGELDRVEPPAIVEKRVARVFKEAQAEIRFKKLEGVGHLSASEAPELLGKEIESFVRELT